MSGPRPQSALERMANGDTVLHLCARYNHWETLKCMMENFGDADFCNSRNKDGNTILHLAAMQKQKESVEYLLHHPSMDANVRNHKGLTALDILSAEKENIFAGGESLHLSISNGNSTLKKQKQKKQKSGRGDEGYNWVQRKRDALMVVASLLATMAFEAGVNPPGGFWQEDKVTTTGEEYKSGHSMFAGLYPDIYQEYIIYNTIGFFASLSIILLLVSGLPLRHRIFMWLLMIIMWIAISTMTFSYIVAIIVLTPEGSVIFTVGVAAFVWMGLIVLLVIAHVIRLIVRAVKRMVKTIIKMMRKRKESVGDSTII